MPAPVVRPLEDIISTLNQGTLGQQQLIDQQIAANNQSGEGQVAGLEQAKTNAFSDITQEGQDKGMFFGGFAPDKQARYVGATYLPALAQLQSQIASARGQLMGRKADIAAETYKTAFGAREGDIAAERSYNTQQEQQQFEQRQAEVDRLWKAGEAEKARAADAKLQADKIAAEYRLATTTAKAKAPTANEITTQRNQGAVNAISSLLSQRGYSKDGYVAPQDYNTLKQAYVANGGAGGTFDANFRQYVNPNDYQKVGFQ
jgi:hypothetical protein